jgi:hypothetical protein
MFLASTCPLDEKDLCFVTCIFGDSVDQVDHPANVEWFADHWCNVRFWLVTNLPHLPAPGWTVHLQHSNSNSNSNNANASSSQQHIVQSREAKFLAWKVLQPSVEACQAVIYMDGYLKPKSFTLRKFRQIGKDVQGSEWGLAQVEQPYFNGYTMETILNNLIKDGKDTMEHVNATLAWLRQQDDYQDVMTYYLNKYFGKYRARKRRLLDIRKD